MTQQRISVDYLARVEGETGLEIYAKDGRIERVELDIFEPPRFFEGFLVGRKFDEVPDLVARICGICPTPHKLTAIKAIERAFRIEPSAQTRALRRLLALSQWIQSHVLHVYMLAAPDYLGYESAIAMAANSDLKPVVERALRLKRLANDLTTLVGGREVHPITPVVNGFSSLPDKDALAVMRKRLVEGIPECETTARLVTSFKLPGFTRKCEHVALRNDDSYPVNEGRLVSTEGLDVTDESYKDVILESHVPHSNAKHAKIEGRDSFLVGPLARVNLNFDKLSPRARSLAAEVGFDFPSFNPFMNAAARALEILNSVEECIDIIDGLELKPEDTRFEVKAGKGFAVTEAARGICCHGYEIDSNGIVQKADIVAPTARNAYNIEKDFYEYAPSVLHLPQDEATLRCEMLIRAYDPCFSCSVHFLDLRIHKD